jgi:hypothetical protein
MTDVVGGFYVSKADEARDALRKVSDHLRIPVPAPDQGGYIEVPIGQNQIILAADEVAPEWRERGWFDFPPAAD